MSFILDALRKAENKNRDRHNLTVPQGPRVLTDELPESRSPERNSALVLILMGAAIASALWWFMRDTSPETPAQRVVNTNPVQSSTASEPANPALQGRNPLPAERPNTRRDTGARALDREARRGETSRDTPLAVQSQVSSPGATTTTRGANSSAQATQPPPVKPGTVTILEADGSLPQTASVPRVQQETLPEYRSSLTAGEVPVPQLHLDIHVYSAVPEKRFVFINLDKYGEGDAIDKDTSIESIEPQGVVINHKGYRFVLQPD